MRESTFQSDEAQATQGVSKDEELAHRFVYDMDDLQRALEANHQQRHRENASTEENLREGLECTSPRAALRELSPTIIALTQRLEQIRSAEVERYRSKLGTLEPFQREAVEGLTRGLLKKILLGPARELKARTGAPEQQAQEQLVRRLFGMAQ